jgi:hypothetical protein
MRAARHASGGDVDSLTTLKPDVRNNERIAFDDEELITALFHRLSFAFPSEFVALPTRTPLDAPVEKAAPEQLRLAAFSPRVRFYKYRPGARFKRHTDGAFVDDLDCSKPRLVFSVLFYLNTLPLAAGGATCLYRSFTAAAEPPSSLRPDSAYTPFSCNATLDAVLLNTTTGTVRVQPQAGVALAFFHKTIHEGLEVTQSTKYVMRLDCMYTSASLANVAN